ncbi:MAG: hypothetical protein LBH31_00400 [Burkholderiaceae bacterium]|jgi:hypothetical protein|nr:hypothetical protein [Burkholderiaceae bacterium]
MPSPATVADLRHITDKACAPANGLDSAPALADQAQNNPQTPAQICAQAPADTLLRLLADCRHPRAVQLRERFGPDLDAQQIDALRSEVLRLLTVCYDAAEVQRRLRALAEPV